MENIGYYLSALKEQKLELASTLNDKGSVSDARESLESLVDKTHHLGYGDGKPLSFCSSKNSIIIKICGSGSVNIYNSETLLRTINLSDDEEVVEEIINTGSGNQCYWFDTLAGVTGLDLSNNDITSISIFGDNILNKLVLYGNSITQLNCSSCKELQFLHIFGNPLCDEDEYEINLENTIKSLPDRIDRAIGSIVFYPWYGLEKLICKDSSGNWIKYPNNHVPLQFEINRLYGVVNDNTVTYYTYKNEGLVNHTSMNRHHTLRKDYESRITLVKNWMFGSAIQYHEDYQYCYYCFRQSGVQDVWETAEKGFGMCIGSIDQYTGTNPEWADMNVKGYFSNGSSAIYTESHPNYAIKPNETRKYYRGFMYGDWQHGDFILSQLAGRGAGIGYGLCPNAQVYLADLWEGSGWISTPKVLEYIEDITENCNTYSSSFIETYKSEYEQVFQKIRRCFGEFGKDNIITLSAGNNGDGQQWTYAPNDYTYMYGDYGTEDNLASTENRSTTFFVAALAPNNRVSTYSSNSMGANNSNYGPFITEEDYISCYGDQILGYRNSLKDRAIKQGTSMASPNCNGILALMRVIYSKIFSECTSFGKGSEFIEYVKKHWMDNLENNMSFATGMGVPCFLAEPQDKKKLLTKFNGVILSSIDYKVGDPVDIIDSIPDFCKRGLTYDFDPKYYAQISSTSFIPIRKPVDSPIVVYTNSSIKDGAKNANYFKSEVSLADVSDADYSLIEDSSKLDSINAELVAGGVSYSDYVVPAITDDGDIETFTVQFAGKFTAEALIPSITEVGEYFGKSVPLVIANINNDSWLGLSFLGLNIKVLADGTRHIDVVTPHDPLSHQDESTTRLVVKDGPNGPRYPSTYANYFSFKTVDGDNFVITLRFTKGIVEVFYNGNVVLYVDTQVYKHKLSDVGVSRISTIHDSVNDVIFYKRALSHSEIVRNTIALIQREENS